jgi:hypothetical protein
MSKATKQSNANSRMLTAARGVLVALLLVLQSFAPVAATGASVSAGVSGGDGIPQILAFVSKPNCATQNDSGRSPTDGHGSTACCILCDARDLQRAALFVLPVEGAAVEQPMAPNFSPRPPRVISKVTRLGWNGVCSSRAPPSRS